MAGTEPCFGAPLANPTPDWRGRWAKEAFEGPVSGEGTFASGKNGQITASLEVAPPPSPLECPNGQRLVLACVTYANITLTDTTNGVSADVQGSVSRTFFALPECA